ncbi:myb/SANT-like DNA-binding domain-containing protein 3 [Helicoverpa armigera]|uniref:myb/SANT-like DNA-binding domain-containing protein 3 n=1 Tax=Helicoverpa armigera TaxID=29058 RepID=UPI00308283E5
MDDFKTKERSVNFTKEEISRLQILVDKYKNVLMCKKTDGSSTKQKDHAWHCIAKEFNAVGQVPRNMKQLKYKFENMKRSAKKVASRERQEMRRTGGGNPPSLPPDSEDATDWLRSIMSGSIDGNEAIYDDDIISQIPLLQFP